MTAAYLHRQDASFGERTWNRIDETVTGIARARLAGRRLLPVEGPYGPALTSIGPETARAVGDREVAIRAVHAQPVPSIESPFRLSMRDIAASEATGQPLDLLPAARAAMACADQEDGLIFDGSEALGLRGLLNADGTQAVKLTEWKEVGNGVDNVLEAVTTLDTAGFRGPYALALTPPLYNLLFRRYPQGNQTELEHLRQAVTGGVVKAAALPSGGVLVTSVAALAAIVVGQDWVTAFVGPAARDYEFVVFETVALRLSEPASVCVLR